MKRFVSLGPMLVDVNMNTQRTTKTFMDSLLAFWPGLQVWSLFSKILNTYCTFLLSYKHVPISCLVPPVVESFLHPDCICDRVCENRSYLHKIHLFILSYLSLFLCGFTISVSLLNSLRNSVYMMKFLIKYYVRKQSY